MENIFAPSVYDKDSILKALQVFLYMLQVFYIILLLRKKGRYCLYFNPFHTIGPFYTSWKVFETFLNMKVEIEDKKMLFLQISAALTCFMPLISFNTPWEHRKTRGFLMFLGSIERDQWHEMFWCGTDTTEYLDIFIDILSWRRN